MSVDAYSQYGAVVLVVVRAAVQGVAVTHSFLWDCVAPETREIRGYGERIGVLGQRVAKQERRREAHEGVSDDVGQVHVEHYACESWRKYSQIHEAKPCQKVAQKEPADATIAIDTNVGLD